MDTFWIQIFSIGFCNKISLFCARPMLVLLLNDIYVITVVIGQQGLFRVELLKESQAFMPRLLMYAHE